MRGHLKALDAGQRASLLMTDAAFAQAALTASPALSGMTPDMAENAARFWMETAMADKVAALDEGAEAIQLAQQAHDLALREMKEAAGLKEAAVIEGQQVTPFADWFNRAIEPTDIRALTTVHA